MKNLFYTLITAILLISCGNGAEKRTETASTDVKQADRIEVLYFLARQESCYFGDIHEELPIAKATVSQHLKELKEVGLIQGEIETPKVKYCINREKWELARNLFAGFFGECKCKDISCCD